MGFKDNDACLAKVDDDEPIFVLAARDLSAPEHVRGWVADNRVTLRAEKADEALHTANLMEAWQQQHPDRAKLPD